LLCLKSTSSRALHEGERHYDVNAEKLPSVTTILQATQPEEKRLALEAWKKCDHWQKSGGEFVQGLHLWIKNMQWENIPDAKEDGNNLLGGRKAKSEIWL